MAFSLSRRLFLGGLLGGVAAWVGGRSDKTAAAMPLSAAPCSHSETMNAHPEGTMEIAIYDAAGRLVSQRRVDGQTSCVSYSYDVWRG